MVAETVLVVIIGASVGIAGLIARLLYNSKCSRVECCYGACVCDRKTEQETTITVDTSNRDLHK